MTDSLTEDTKAITLLCGVFGKDRSAKPLSQKEYSSIVRWLVSAKMRPSDLLRKENIPDASGGAKIDKGRLEALLGRGVQFGFAVEEWQRNGIWIISRGDADYPNRYKKRLKDDAPPLLFGVGNRSLLQGGGLAIVGSRNVDRDGEEFSRKVAELCAYNRVPVVSGGARGVDQIAMDSSLDAGGMTIGILAGSLLKRSVERRAREAIADERLLLLSPNHPDARFHTGHAMRRNRLIYNLADYGLVVSAEHKKGGSWAGAEEELNRKASLPVFVRTGNDVPKGNSKLLDLGAIRWPNSIDRDNFKQLLTKPVFSTLNDSPKENLNLFDAKGDQQSAPANNPPPATDAAEDRPTVAEPAPVAEPEGNTQGCPVSIYQAVLPVMLKALDRPVTAPELAEALSVNKTQLNAWLKIAVDENMIVKLKKPVRYQRASPES